VWTCGEEKINIFSVTAFIKQLAVAAIRVAAEAAGLVGIGDQERLWTVVWGLSKDKSDGKRLIEQVYRKQGIESARIAAEKVLGETKSCALASVIGFLELISGQGAQAAAEWVRSARESGYNEPEELLHLELVLSDSLDDYDRRKSIEQILARNDLPSSVTAAALIGKAELCLQEQRLEEAERIAERILSIEEQPAARLIKWAVCLAKGGTKEAAEHLANAKSKLPREVFDKLVERGKGRPAENENSFAE
jgi:hypothetical protein